MNKSEKIASSTAMPTAVDPLETVQLTEGYFRSIAREKRFPDFLRERYVPRRLIGRGGFGSVHLAEDMKLGRLVAIKRLYSDYAKGSEVYERFIQEARIAGQLEHPNIVIVYNIEEDEREACLIMEYLGGGSLRDLIHKTPKMDVRTSIQIMLGVLTGLDAAHHIMVVHRDVKPQNILFGIGSNPKITDFGIAHLPVSAGGSPDIEKGWNNSSLLGSPLYMAPEQVLLADLDARTDIYAAGVIFHEMLTGEKLFQADSNTTYASIRKLVIEAEPHPIKKFRDDVCDELENIIKRMHAKRPDDRYEDAVSVKKDLIHCLKSLPARDNSLSEGELWPTPIHYFLNSPAAILEDIISLLLVDGVITDAERQELNRRAEKLGFSEHQTKLIEEKVRNGQHNKP